MRRFRKPPPTWPPPKKMPVSYLEELCSKKNIQPIYEYLDIEGQDHEAIFKYKACVEDLTGVGRGKNKKIAKHYAVLDLLHKIVDCGRQKEWFGENGAFYNDYHQFLKEILFDLDPMPGGLNEMTAAQRRLEQNGGDHDQEEPNGRKTDDDQNDDDDESPIAVADDTSYSNPINSLAELCCRRCWPEPVYCETQESGLPHERTFAVRLHLGKFCVEESGRSKKLAKKQAAESMLKLLYESPLEQRDQDLVVVEDPVVSENGENQEQNFVQNTKIDHEIENGDFRCETIPEDEELELEVEERDKVENGQFSDPKSRQETDECLSILKNTEWFTVEKPDQEHKDLMMRVSKIFGFQTSFLHLPRKPESDLRQCLLKIDDGNMTCFGYGSTEQEAEFRASLNALDLYKRNIS